MKLLELLLIILSIVWPIPYYWELAFQYDNEALFSQYLGSVSLILMGISQFLSTRIKGIETIFGSLDRIYILHKWLGIIAIAAMMFHDTIDAEIRKIGPETWLSDAAEEGGEIALYGLLILLVISLTTFVPYDLWKRTHKFIGAFFALSAFHYLYILKPFQLNDPVGIYISTFCFVGMASYIYTLFVHTLLQKPKAYKVENITCDQNISQLSLTPVNSSIRHKAGQFAFLHINDEKHPFTIASSPNKTGELKFAIKALGDFSKKIQTSLHKNDIIHVSSPYGRFLMPAAKQQVWIAGGIGITPFLSWLGSTDALTDKEIHLYYCIRSNGPLAPFEEQLIALCDTHSGIKLHIINSVTMPHLTLEQIQRDTDTDIKQVSFSFCGPKTLRKTLQEDLAPQKLNYEEFEFRSGITFLHLQSLLLWLFSQAKKLRR